MAEADGNAVVAGNILIGMTPSMVIESWGMPDNVNSTLTAAGETQQWVYDIGDYVYFNARGLVEAVQTSR